MEKVSPLIPEMYNHFGYRYYREKKCKMIPCYNKINIYTPDCNPEIFITNVDEDWKYCPFCGGTLIKEEKHE